MKQAKNQRRNKAIFQNFSDISSRLETELLFNLSDGQRAALLSMCDYLKWKTRYVDGSDYSEDELVTFAETVERALTMPIDLCQAIADCINDLDSPTRQALRDALADTDNPILPNRNLPVDPITRVLGEETASESGLFTGCDYDSIFGLCKQIIAFTDALAFDAFQIIEVASNAVEALAIAADSVPALGESLEFASFVQDAAYEMYLAANTEAFENELACELFCMAIETCELSLEDVRGFFRSKCTASYPITIDEFLQVIIQSASGELVVYNTWSLLWECILSGVSWFGYDTAEALIRIISSFYNDPNPDWATLCSECAGEVLRLEGYGNADMASYTYNGASPATYRPTEDDYLSNHSGGAGGEIAFWDVRFAFEVPTLITSISWKITYRRGFAGGGVNGADLIIDGVSVQTHFITYSETEQTFTFTWSGSQEVTEIRTTGGVFVDPHYSVGGKIERLNIGLG